MRNSAIVKLVLGACALGGLGCTGSQAPVTPDAKVSVTVAALDLPLMSDACYGLAVFNTANIEDMHEDTLVWTQPSLCASNYGAEGGIRFTGICDAQAGGFDDNGTALDVDHNNTVRLVLNDIYTGGDWDGDGVALTADRDYVNPCPDDALGSDNGCILKVPCTANQDKKVLFNLTVMRDAQLGFFDTVVKFQDVFCAAKLDCLDDDNSTLMYLHNPDADPPADGPTAVLGFTCLGGDGVDISMYLDDLEITCATGSGDSYTVTRTATIDPSGGPGNLASPDLTQTGTQDVLFGAAVNAGAGFQGAQYWNVLLGMNLPGQAGESCILRTTGTVSEVPFDDFNATPSLTRYPYIDWTIDLTEDGNRSCTRHPLNGEDGGVETLYTPLDEATSFDHLLVLDDVDFCGGTGTGPDPFRICRIADLAELDAKLSDPISYAAYASAYYVQTNDLDFGGQARGFLLLGSNDLPLTNRHDLFSVLFAVPSERPFLGTYDGNGKHLANLAFESSGAADFQGLFTMLGASAVVKDLVFDAPSFNLADTVVAGTVAGYSSGRVDGIVINNLAADLGHVTYFGGVVGYQNGGPGLYDITVSGAIVGSTEVSTILDASFQPLATTNEVGGVVALLFNANGTITTTLGNVDVDVAINVGGAIGGVVTLAIGQIALIDVQRYGAVHTGSQAGGIAQGIAWADALGIAGLAPPRLDGVVNWGDVVAAGTTSSGTRIGGIAASIIGATFNEVHNHGNVANNHPIGGGAAGLSGNADSVTFTRVSSTGDISNRTGQFNALGDLMSFSDVAGLIGYVGQTNQVSISDCFSTGLLTGGPDEYDIGGLIADLYDLQSAAVIAVHNCYAANTFSGGRIGAGAAFGNINIRSRESPSITFTNIYWNTATGSGDHITGFNGDTAFSAPTQIIALSPAQMQDASSFVGFDFTNIWWPPVGNAYPLLR